MEDIAKIYTSYETITSSVTDAATGQVTDVTNIDASTESYSIVFKGYPNNSNYVKCDADVYKYNLVQEDGKVRQFSMDKIQDITTRERF